MRKKTRFLAAALAAAMVFSMAACGGGDDSKGTQAPASDNKETQAATQGGSSDNDKSDANTPSGGGNKTVTIAMTSPWASWNPYVDSGNYSDIIADQLYERLWVANKDGTVEPRLAESYEVAEDHTHMIVHLDKNAKFHDGEPVTADDVIFSVQLDANPEFNSVKRDQLQYVAGTTTGGLAENGVENVGFEKIDDYTVKITFKEAMNELPILTMMNRYVYIVPEHIYSKYSIAELNESETWKNNMVGCGPFKFDTAIDGDRVELVRYEDYHLGTPDIERLIIRVVEPSQFLSGLMTGEIDMIAGAGIGSLSLADWPTAQAEESLETVSTTNFAYQTMIINMTSEKIPNAKCRNAINMAINRQSIVDNLLLGEGTVLYAPFSDDHPFVDTSKLTMPEYNPEAAKKQLEENGFDFSQTLELIVPTGNEVRIQSTVLIQQDLEAIGVKTNITQYDFPTLMDMMKKGQYDLGMCGSAGAIEPTEASGWINNEGTTNFPCVQDDTFISLYNKAKYILDLDEQKEAYVEVWQKLLDESPICYLYSSNHLLAYNKRLSNLDPNKFPQVNWATWEWKVAD
ncbi:MAG: peptide ABC transporter substrate-binding protein [Lachnospiraceae bacterium]|nr:peptide ABC transporter substrate-binding protein [Lachnospiraceae bacterium]